jgi:hypothetical protein
MAVYEHLYGAYEGESHSKWSRFLVIPRYALRETFKSKLFTTIFILCFIYPLIATTLVYLHHNANALALLQKTSASECSANFSWLAISVLLSPFPLAKSF